MSKLEEIVVQALRSIAEDPALLNTMVIQKKGEELVKVGSLTELINQQNQESFSAHAIGSTLRDLKMRMTGRMRDGFWMYWSTEQIRRLDLLLGPVEPPTSLEKLRKTYWNSTETRTPVEAAFYINGLEKEVRRLSQVIERNDLSFRQLEMILKERVRNTK